MKPKWYRLIVCLSFVLSAIGSNAYAADLVLNNVPVTVYFQTNDGCTKAIVDELNSANTEILVQLCSLDPWPITDAISKAHKRGVKVEAIIDKKIIDHSSLLFIRFKHSGNPIFVDETNISANNKVMIIDGRTVLPARSVSPGRPRGIGRTTCSLSSPENLRNYTRKTGRPIGST